MTHQVNLNSKHLVPGHGPVQLPLFSLVTLITTLICAIWFLFSWQERQLLLEEEARLQQAFIDQQQELVDFQAQHPNINNEPELLLENEQLTTNLNKARETYSGLASQMENAIEGFNRPLIQLSDFDLNGLWLNRIALQDGKLFFALEGFARTPELIPQYIEQLGDSDFQGITIQQLSVAKEDQQKLWRFTLSNTRQADITEAQQ